MFYLEARDGTVKVKSLLVNLLFTCRQPVVKAGHDASPSLLDPRGYYHVTCLSNDRRAIYRDEQDRSLFVEKLRVSLANYDVVLHAYEEDAGWSCRLRTCLKVEKTHPPVRLTSLDVLD